MEFDSNAIYEMIKKALTNFLSSFNPLGDGMLGSLLGMLGFKAPIEEFVNKATNTAVAALNKPLSDSRTALDAALASDDAYKALEDKKYNLTADNITKIKEITKKYGKSFLEGSGAPELVNGYPRAAFTSAEKAKTEIKEAFFGNPCAEEIATLATGVQDGATETVVTDMSKTHGLLKTLGNLQVALNTKGKEETAAGNIVYAPSQSDLSTENAVPEPAKKEADKVAANNKTIPKSTQANAGENKTPPITPPAPKKTPDVVAMS